MLDVIRRSKERLLNSDIGVQVRRNVVTEEIIKRVRTILAKLAEHSGSFFCCGMENRLHDTGGFGAYYIKQQNIVQAEEEV